MRILRLANANIGRTFPPTSRVSFRSVELQTRLQTPTRGAAKRSDRAKPCRLCAAMSSTLSHRRIAHCTIWQRKLSGMPLADVIPWRSTLTTAGNGTSYTVPSFKGCIFDVLCSAPRFIERIHSHKDVLPKPTLYTLNLK